ncbi:Uncharacterised protein [Haemophilus parainfluenzae]|uniref:Uncharacterized protein n=1 Tax=Haemophilus parainfluenzae TaxID=729 RepID=A0A377JED3_HAEPA|nr:Uncharacterised protein [Haemophilus parainfluenzae]
MHRLKKLQAETENLSEDEALDAWVQKLIEGDKLLSEFGESFLENTEQLSKELQEAGLSAEQVEKVIGKLKSAIEQKTDATEKDTKAVEDNAKSTENLSDNIIDLWATQYGGSRLIE